MQFTRTVVTSSWFLLRTPVTYLDRTRVAWAAQVRELVRGSSFGFLLLRQHWLMRPLGGLVDGVRHTLAHAYSRQPLFLALTARGFRSWSRGGSRALRHGARAYGAPTLAPKITTPTASGWASFYLAGVVTARGGVEASTVLDRGFFFPNMYKPAPGVVARVTTVRRGWARGTAARGRAGRLSRGLLTMQYGGAHARIEARATSGVRLRPKLWRAVAGVRRRVLGSVTRAVRLLRRRSRRLFRMTFRSPKTRRTGVRRTSRWAVGLGSLAKRPLSLPWSMGGHISPALGRLVPPASIVGGGAFELGRVAPVSAPGRLERGELRLADLLGRFRQPQVRYKPGFMRHWRQHRAVFRKTTHLPWGSRQHRLTRYVVKLRRLAAFSYYKYTQLMAARVVGASWLAGPGAARVSWHAAMRGLLTLNGQLCVNPLAQLYRGDVVALTSGWWCGGLGLGSQPLATAGRRVDTPYFLEVDELSLTIVVLQEPRWLAPSTLGAAPVFPFTTLKCYNWKYLT